MQGEAAERVYEDMRQTVREISRKFGKTALMKTIELLRDGLIHPLFISIDWDAAESISPQLAAELRRTYMLALKRALTQERGEETAEPEELLSLLPQEIKSVGEKKDIPHAEAEAKILEHTIGFIQAWVRSKKSLPYKDVVETLRETTNLSQRYHFDDSFTILSSLYYAARNCKKLITTQELAEKLRPQCELLLNSPIPAFRYYVAHYALWVIFQLLNSTATTPNTEAERPKNRNTQRQELAKAVYHHLLQQYERLVKEGRETSSFRDLLTTNRDFLSQEELQVTINDAINILRTLISLWYSKVTLQKVVESESVGVSPTPMIPLVYLIGPRGVGKTSIASAVANEVGVPVVHLTATAMVREDIQMPVRQQLSLSEIADKARVAVSNLKEYFTNLTQEAKNPPNIQEFAQFIIRSLEQVEDIMNNPAMDIATKSIMLQNEHRDALSALLEFYTLLQTHNIPTVGKAITSPEKYLEKVFHLGDFMSLNLTQFKFQLTGTLGKLQAAQQPFVLFIDEIGYNVNVVNSFLAALTHGVFSDMKLPPFFAIVASNIPEKEGAQVPLPPFIARATVLYVTQNVEDLYRYSEEVTLLALFDAAASHARVFRGDIVQPDTVLAPPPQFDLLTSPDAAPVRDSIISAIDEYLTAWRNKEVEKLYPLLLNLESVIDTGIKQLQADNPIAYTDILPPHGRALLATISRIKNMQTERIIGRMRDQQLTFVKQAASRLGTLRYTAPQEVEMIERVLGNAYSSAISIAQEVKHHILEQLRTSTNQVLRSAAQYLEAGQPLVLYGELVVAPSPRAIIDYYTSACAAALYRLICNTILEHIESALREGKPRVNITKIIQAIAEKLHRQTPHPAAIRGDASFKRESIPEEIRTLFHITTGMVGEKLAREMLAITIEHLTTHIFPREQLTDAAYAMVNSVIRLYNFTVEDPSQQVTLVTEGKIDIKETFANLVERSLSNFLRDRQQVIQYLNTNFANAASAENTFTKIISTIENIVERAIVPNKPKEELAEEIENILTNLNNQRDYIGIVIAAITIIHRLASIRQERKRRSAISPLESEDTTIQTIAQMIQNRFNNILSTFTQYASDAIASDPNNKDHQLLAVSLTNFLNMLLVLPSKATALRWVIDIPNIRGLLASWLAFLYSVGFATAVAGTSTIEVVTEERDPSVRNRRKDIAERLRKYYTIETATGEVTEIMEAIGRNIDLASDILAQVIKNPTEIVKVIIEPQPIGEAAQKFAQLMQARIHRVIQNPYLVTVARYAFYPSIYEWGLEKEDVGIDPNELREELDPQKTGREKGRGLFVSEWVAQAQTKLINDLAWPTAVISGIFRKCDGTDIVAAVSTGIALFPIALLPEDKRRRAVELLSKLAPMWEQSKREINNNFIGMMLGIDLHQDMIEFILQTLTSMNIALPTGREKFTIIGSALIYLVASELSKRMGKSTPEEVYETLRRDLPLPTLNHRELEARFGGRLDEWVRKVEAEIHTAGVSVLHDYRRLIDWGMRRLQRVETEVPTPPPPPTTTVPPEEEGEEKEAITNLLKGMVIRRMLIKTRKK